MTLEQASRYPGAMDRVRERVKPDRERNKDRYRRENWWLFGRPYVDARRAIDSQARYIAMNQVGKRALFAWFGPEVCPNSKTNIFAFEDDYSMGILLSHGHGAWAWHQGATLKGDLSYTPTSVFMTFAWPDPVTDVQREAVAEASRRLLARRSEICTSEQIGLTKLYNAVDEGAWTDLVALHRELDGAVADCYGWPPSVAQDDRELVRRLTARNREISEGGRAYDPFASQPRDT